MTAQTQGTHMERLRLMADNWQHFTPFMLATGNHMQVNITRVIETLIIAGVTSAVVLYGSHKYMQAEFEGIKSDVQSLEREVEGMRRDLYIPIGKK